MTRAEFSENLLAEINRRGGDAQKQSLLWIKRATGRLNQDLRVKEMLQHVVRPISAPRFPVPPGFLRVRTLRLTAGDGSGLPVFNGRISGPLEYASPEDLTAVRAPGYYTNYGSEIELSAGDYSGNVQADLWYFGKMRDLLTDADTNPVLEAYYDLYFDAAMVYALSWTMEPDQSLTRAALVASAIERLNSKYETEKYGDGPLTARPPVSTVRRRFS